MGLEFLMDPDQRELFESWKSWETDMRDDLEEVIRQKHEGVSGEDYQILSRRLGDMVNDLVKLQIGPLESVYVLCSTEYGRRNYSVSDRSEQWDDSDEILMEIPYPGLPPYFTPRLAAPCATHCPCKEEKETNDDRASKEVAWEHFIENVREKLDSEIRRRHEATVGDDYKRLAEVFSGWVISTVRDIMNRESCSGSHEDNALVLLVRQAVYGYRVIEEALLMKQEDELVAQFWHPEVEVKYGIVKCLCDCCSSETCFQDSSE